MWNNKSVALEIDGNTLKALFIQKKDKNNFSVISHYESRFSDEESLKSSLKKIFSETQTSNVILSFDRESLVLRALQAKSHSNEDMDEAIKKELEEGLPFTRNSISWDADIFDKKSVKAAILFAAASQENTEKMCKAVKESGLSVSVLVPSTVALMEAYRASSVYSKKAALVVNAGNSRIDLFTSENDAIIMSRGFKTKKDKVNEIIRSMKETIKAMEKNGLSVDKVVLGASAEEYDSISSAVKKELNIKTEKLGLPANYSGEIKTKGQGASNWILIAGLALAGSGLGRLNINLNKNSEDAAKKPSLNQRIRKVTIIVSVLMFLAALVFFVMNMFRQGEVNELKSQVTGAGLMSGRHWSEIFTQVFKSVPKGIVLTEVSADERGELVLRGTSDERKEIMVFLDALNKLSGVSAELSFANEVNTGNKQVVQFQVKVRQKAAVK